MADSTVVDTGVPPADDDDDPAAVALTPRRPDIPTNLETLAALKGEAIAVVEARVTVLTTLRKASIRSTSPEDWTKFKTNQEHGGQEVAYLSDAGCDRVADLFGIEKYGISKPEKVVGADPTQFHYLIQGSGRCKLTGQVLECVEGGRSSSDEFVKGKTGVELELLVRKAARANLDGNIVRELAGLKSVPVAELAAAWAGTNKRVEQCRRGRGYGTADERVGGTRESEPDVPPPVCPHCGAKARFRPARGDRGAFYGCPNYEKHADKKWTVDAAKWIAQSQQQAPAEPPLTAADVNFGGSARPRATREPGQEG